MKINKFNPIIKTNQLKIRFGDFVANQNINLSVYAGQIQSIVGENGAGKSTLMKMLYGTYKPTSGEILVDRERVHMTPQIAMRLGIGMVFTANNIHEAKGILKVYKVDILLCDVDMPMGSGLELVEWIREEGMEIKCIFLSSYANFTYAQKALRLG